MAVRRRHAFARFQPNLQAGDVAAVQRLIELMRKRAEVVHFRRSDKVEAAARHWRDVRLLVSRSSGSNADQAGWQPLGFNTRLADAGNLASLSIAREGRTTSAPPQLGHLPLSV